jgi:hypothetical protein
LKLDVKGLRTVSFQDGTEIKFENFHDYFGNSLIGTSYHYSFGDLKFVDKKNGISAFINFGGCKNKPKDYFQGYIE